MYDDRDRARVHASSPSSACPCRSRACRPISSARSSRSRTSASSSITASTPFASASALLADLHLGRLAQGGSTITQQLARQSFLTSDKTFRRKVQELILALRLERHYSKTEILELYLNTVYFGDGLYGAEAASRGYFGKSAADLSVDEAALLAGLIKAPSAYAPTTNPDRAVARRNLVLELMADENLLDRRDVAIARVGARRSRSTTRTPRRESRTGSTSRSRSAASSSTGSARRRVYEGGLRVFTTVDMPMQEASESVVRQSLEALDAATRRRRPADAARRPDALPLQAALVALDPASGDVRAMVGGRDFDESPFNRAVQAHRQPGSAFKPFVYAAALEAGFAPATVISELNDPIETPEGDWTPADENLDVDSMSLRAALRTSSNRAAVHLLQKVGISRAVRHGAPAGRRRSAAGAVAGARLRRGDAAVADRRVRRVRESRPRSASAPHPPRRG